MKNNFFRKWLALSALFAFMCFSPHMLSRAQSTANYAFSTNTTGSLGLDMNGNVVDMTTGTTQVLTTNTSQDQAINGTAITFPAGFEFYMAGNRFTSYFATSNGLVQLGTTAVIIGSTYVAGGGTLTAPRITAFDGDLGTGTTGGIFGKLIGTGPNRCYVIEFRNMSLMWTNAYPNNGTYQVRFYEGTGVIEFVYGTMNCGSVASAGDATPEVGFSWGTGANQSVSLNIATSALDLTGTMIQNTIVAGAIPNLNSAAEGSRRIYRFTPPAIPVAPTALTFSGVGSSYMALNWVDNSTTEFAYTVSRSLDGVTYTNVATLPSNTVTYLASGLNPSTLYYWNVVATSESGSSTPVLSGNQSTLSCSPISGIKTVGAGGDYPNLSIAFSDINSCSLSGNTELQLIAGYPAMAESYPINGPATTPVGAFTLKVYPMVSGLSITSNNTTGTLNLNNSTNLTIDGRVNQTGAADLVISNTNAGPGYAVQFVNDAKSNVLQYLTIQSSNTASNSGTIVFAGSTGTTGNDNNLIDHCDIRDGASTPTNAIYSSGTSVAIDNSGNTVSNSNIFNFFNSGNNSNGIFLASNSSAWTINANKFYQTATRTATAAANLYRGINIVTSSGNGYVITNNVIGYSSASATGVMTYNGAFTSRLFGIELTASNTGTASSIQGNTVTAISFTTTSGATTAPGIFAGISVLGGNVSIGNTTPNIIGAATGTGAISITTSTSGNVYGIHASSSSTLNVVNNVVGSISGTGSVAGATCHIAGMNIVGSGTAYTITGNTIGGTTPNSITSGTSAFTTTSATVSGITVGTVTTLSMSGNTVSNIAILGAAGTLYGINSGTSQYTFNNNVIHDLSIPTNAGTSASVIYGMYNLASPTVENITNSQIYNLSVAGATTSTSNIVTGIHSGTTTSTKNFSQNQVNGLSFANSSTGTATVNGISSTTGTTVSVFRNKIYNLSASGTGSTVNGILNSSGTTVNVYNNVIGDLRTPTASAADPIRGISITSTAAPSTYRVYYNSVYLNASSTGTNFGTSGIYHAVSATVTTAALDLRNNIIINGSTPSGTGITVAFRRSGVALGNFASTSNRNMLYAGAPSATNLVMYDGTTSYQTIAAYQAAVAPREINSFTGEAMFIGAGYGTAGNFFISTTPSNANYLKPVAGITTQVESGAVNITTPAITDDYAAVVRQGNAGYTGTGTAPDLGAFEFEGVTPTPVITLNSVTPPVATQCAATARVISVDVNPSAGTTASVNLGYAINGVAQTAIVMTNSSGSTWTATIPVPTPGNATITWGITATNSLGITGTYTGASYWDEPLTGVSSSVVASSTTLCAGTPTTLTAALTKAGSAVLGTGSTVSTSTAAQNPFYGGYGGVKTQYLIRASELTALGLLAGNITQLSVNITTAGSTLNGFAISAENTALTVLTGNIEAVGNQVYSTASFVPAVGVNNFPFSTPLVWDGVSNIIVSFCWSNANTSNTASQLLIANTAFVSGNARYVDSRTSAEVCGYTGSATPVGWNGGSTTVSSRPIFTFVGNMSFAIQSVSWSDGVGTVGTTNPLAVSPTVTTTYTAAITAAGCTVAPAPTVSITVNPLPTAPTAVNSAQCGVQIPTAHVTSTSGLPTPSFNWYAASSGGSALQSGTSTTYTSTVSSTTTFYVSELNSATGCESARVPVTVTVSTPDQVSLTASVASICLGGTFTLTAANTNPTPFQSYTYSTQSATTGSGAETPIAGTLVSVTPTAAGTFTYTVTGVDGGCAASATASVVVNPLPAVVATATPVTVCSGDNITLSGNIPGVNSGPIVIGAGALTGSSDYYNPFYHLFGGIKSQYIIPASELTAAGLTAGNIGSVALNIGTTGSAYAGFTIHMGATAAANLSAGLSAATLTQVYSTPSLVLTPSSLNTFTFGTPFVWDGTSNLIVQLSWSNNNGGGTSSEIQYDNTAYVATAYYRADNLTPAAILAGTTATGTRSTRPKMTFATNYNANYTWSWAPGTGLNTSSATTSITNASGSAVTQAFTVTTTNTTTGCVSTTTTPAVTINSSVPAPVANNSTQCGVGTPTASVTGTGVSGNTFSWYLVSTGGTAISGQTGSSLTGYPVTATTTFYVSEVGSGCTSPRTPVTVTVTPAPAITVAGTATICQGSSTSLTASSANTGYSYSWSGALGTGATVSASPTATTTYTVTGTDASGGANNGCVGTATYTVTVNPAPTTAPVVPATATICAGDLQHLTSGPTTATAIFGNGTTAPGTTAYPNPLSAYYGGAKHQILFTAAELTAQGLVPGSQISSVTFDLNTFVTSACTNFTIRMGNTALNALTGFVAGTTTVYGPTTFTPSAAGLVTFTLTAPYTWNGTSNIVVETVHNAGNAGNGSGTRTNTTTTLANTVYSAAADDVLGGIAGFDALTSWDISAASNLRPNIRFVYTGAGPVWSPAASLYTDAAGTVAYTGTGASSVYAKPTTTTTYVATYTGSNGCTAQRTATITVNQPSASTVAPVTSCVSYTWAQTGLTYTTSGTYRDTIPNAVGCDSVISLNLTITQPSTSTVTQIACQTYTWTQNGMTYTTSGAYTDTITNAAGCDSVVTLNLTIGAPNASLFPMTACGSYTWPQTGLTYTVSGAYNDTLTNIYGCDSVVTLSLTINLPSGSSVAPVTECTSYTWSQTGLTYNVSGTYTDTLTNAVGCDSIITLNLTIIQPTTSTQTVVECTTYTWAQNGTTYTASGMYTDTIQNSVGCDSIITLNLTIHSVTMSTVTVSTCNPTYTWAQNGTVYNTSGTYSDTIVNAAGCDSIIVLNLTIAPFVATATLNANATVTASTGTSYQWINCATNAPISGATAQTFAPTVNGSYAVVVSNGTCTDTSNCVNVTNVGIKENLITTISVHPNPTHDVVIVTMEAVSAEVEVMDVQGKLVQTTQIKSGGQIDLSAYERGVYTLRIKTEAGTAIERIVKN